MPEPTEVIHVQREEVTCDGPKGPSGHPRVYLHIDRAVGYVICPYCSRQYWLDEQGEHRHA